MRVRLKRNMIRQGVRWRKNKSEGHEMPFITAIPTDDLPMDAEVLVGDEWKVNNPDKVEHVKRELLKPVPSPEQVAMQRFSQPLQPAPGEKTLAQVAAEKKQQEADAEKRRQADAKK